MPTLRISIDSSKAVQKDLFFSCVIHTARTQSEMLIDRAFYTNAVNEVPQCEHSELEVIEDTNSFILNSLPPEIVHITTSKLNGRKFVCYPGRIPNIVEVVRVYLIWCIGTAYTISHHDDFQNVADTKDINAFLSVMKHLYGIKHTDITLSTRI